MQEVEHQALLLADISETNVVKVNESHLKRILMQDEVQNSSMSVISITGAFRQGKSFLLNFMLRYLNIRYVKKENVTNWLRPEDGPLKGFNWAPGSKRHTVGILMWSEIFFAEKLTGEKVAVMLIDTQGSFDHNSSVTDCASVFALSTLISSVQIYNLMRTIKQCDLSHLRCFGDYGKLLAKNDGQTPFQKLMVLVRDWPFSFEKAFGREGGDALLSEVFQTKNKELNTEYNHVKELFDDIECFLLPHPGKCVATSQGFSGHLDDINDDFKARVQDFVNHLLAPENLILKTVNGTNVKGKDLLDCISEYGKLLESGVMPQFETIFETSVRLLLRMTLRNAIDHYKSEMANRAPRSIAELHNSHSIAKVNAVKRYQQDNKQYRDRIGVEDYMTLKNEVDQCFENTYRPEFDDNHKRRHEVRQRILNNKIIKAENVKTKLRH